jgi:hypothetical protein
MPMMTGARHCTQLYWFSLHGVLVTFGSGWPQTTVILISASWVAWLAGVNHHTLPVLCIFGHCSPQDWRIDINHMA